MVDQFDPVLRRIVILVRLVKVHIEVEEFSVGHCCSQHHVIHSIHVGDAGGPAFVVEPNPDVVKRAVFTNCCLKKIKGGTFCKSTYSVLSKVTSSVQPGKSILYLLHVHFTDGVLNTKLKPSIAPLVEIVPSFQQPLRDVSSSHI